MQPDYKDNFYIIFFELNEEECPVQDFLDSLDDKMAAKIYGLMDVLAEHGNGLRGPYSKHLDDGIFELRAKVGSDITRTLYFFYVEKKIIMTNGFVKKTQKTPKSVIDTAKKYRKMFLEEAKKKEKRAAMRRVDMIFSMLESGEDSRKLLMV